MMFIFYTKKVEFFKIIVISRDFHLLSYTIKGLANLYIIVTKHPVSTIDLSSFFLYIIYIFDVKRKLTLQNTKVVIKIIFF